MGDAWVTAYEDTGEYLVIDSKVYTLFGKYTDHQIYFSYNGDMLAYDEQRDGPTVDKVAAKEKYPEYFV